MVRTSVMRLNVRRFWSPIREFLPRQDYTSKWIEIEDKQEFVGALSLYLKPVLTLGEVVIAGSSAQKRMIEMLKEQDVLGFVHAWHVFEARKYIPHDWKNKRLLFPASLWRNMSCDCRYYSPELGCHSFMDMDKRYRCDTVFFCITGGLLEPHRMTGNFLGHDFLVCAEIPKTPNTGMRVD